VDRKFITAVEASLLVRSGMKKGRTLTGHWRHWSAWDNACHGYVMLLPYIPFGDILSPLPSCPTSSVPCPLTTLPFFATSRLILGVSHLKPLQLLPTPLPSLPTNPILKRIPRAPRPRPPQTRIQHLYLLQLCMELRSLGRKREEGCVLGLQG
jgi:hypothetical protein